MKFSHQFAMECVGKFPFQTFLLITDTAPCCCCSLLRDIQIKSVVIFFVVSKTEKWLFHPTLQLSL